MLHGAQLWVALPETHRHAEPGFVHHAPPELNGPGWTARVFLGSLLGETSPVPTATPLLGAEIRLAPGTSLGLAVESGFEHGVLVDQGAVAVDGQGLAQNALGYLAPGPAQLTLTTHDVGARLLLLGGEPFGEEIVMWWNFVGRSHEEIAGFREEWQTQIAGEDGTVADSQQVSAGRYGVVLGDHLPPIPAPLLPHVRLRPRR